MQFSTHLSANKFQILSKTFRMVVCTETCLSQGSSSPYLSILALFYVLMASPSSNLQVNFTKQDVPEHLIDGRE